MLFYIQLFIAKTMKKLILILTVFVSGITFCNADSGVWRSHLAYSAITQVAETQNNVFGVSEGALFSYNKTSQAITVYSKVNGLNDNKVSLIAYSPVNQVLMVVYDNANIDLIYEDGKILNLSDIKDNNLALNKTVNRINFYNNTAYLSTAYGITIVNLDRKEVSNSYLLSKKVYGTTIYNGTIYAATDQGIISAAATANLQDPGNWTVINQLKASDITVFQNTLLAVVSGTGLYSFNSSAYQLIKSSTVIKNLFVANNVLVCYGTSQLSFFTALNQETAVSGSDFYQLSALDPTVRTWYAASSNGLNRIDKTSGGYSKVILTIKPQGPFANSPYKMRFSGSKLMVVGGGAWNDRYSTAGMMMFFNNEQWSYIRLDTIKAQGSSVKDLTDIVEDPRETGHYFVTSYGEGVYEFRNNKLVKIHDHTNSGIETVNLAVLKGANHFDRTYGMCYDKDNNLYVTNCFTANIIKVLSKDGVWSSLNYPQIANNEAVFDIMQTKSGVFWTLAPWSNPKCLAFNPNGTLTNQSDDQTNAFSSLIYTENGEQKSVTPDNFFCMAEDLNGAVWIGTNKGPFIVSNSAQAFDPSFTFSRVRLTPTAGTPIPGFLLDGENVRVIAVDASNRKWIGTEASGVYLVSENGKQILYHFTQENSPLPSNLVLSIAIHPTTGEVFIGTDKGLASYRNDALSNQKNFTEVYASPNPLRPEYNGSVMIYGLKTDASVRITDLNGNSIYEGTATESQLSWDGKDKSGNRVATGIYLVYASTSDSLEELVTKIMVVK